MPTPTEIIKQHLKYCSKKDTHCCCLTCDKFNKTCHNICNFCERFDKVYGRKGDRDPYTTEGKSPFRCYRKT